MQFSRFDWGWGKASGGARRCVLTLLGLVLGGAGFDLRASEHVFLKAALDLEREAQDAGRVNLGVGNFPNSGLGAKTPFSDFIRSSLEVALAKTEQFSVVTRNNIGELQLEDKFQKRRIVDPNSPGAEFKIAAIDGLVRGSYFVLRDTITVFVEIAWLNGGGLEKVQLELDRSTLPDESVWEPSFHAPINPDRVPLHVLASSFSKDAEKRYPVYVKKLSDEGYFFAVWTVLEEFFSDHPQFELYMEPGGVGNLEFLQDFIKSTVVEGDSKSGPKAMVATESKLFVKKNPQNRTGVNETFTIEIVLTFFNLKNEPWYRDPIVVSGLAPDAENPLVGARKAATEAAKKLIRRLQNKQFEK